MIRAVAALLVILAASGARAEPITNVFFGDSVTQGANVNGPAGAYYPWLYSSARGERVQMRAVSGANTADQMAPVYAHTPAAGQRSFIMIGTNDRLFRGDGVAQVGMFKAALSAEAYWLAAQGKPARGPAWRFLGAWEDTPGSPIGRYTTQAGASAVVEFEGDVFVMGHLLHDGGGAKVGAFSVSIDGVGKGSFTGAPQAKIAAHPFNLPYMPAMIRIAGNGPGKHKAIITAGKGGGYVFLDWAGSVTPRPAPLFLMTIPRTAAEPMYKPVGTSTYPSQDASIAAFNEAISAVAAQAKEDGLSVRLVDASSWIDPASDLWPDGVHPSTQGHLNIVGALNAASK